MKKRRILIRRFRCPECGQIMSACKARGTTHEGHIKTFYCPVCRQDRDFVQFDQDKTLRG